MNRIWFIILLVAYTSGAIYLSFRIDSLSQQIEATKNDINNRISEIEAQINDKVDKTNAKMILLASKLDELENKTDGLNQNIIIDPEAMQEAKI